MEVKYPLCYAVKHKSKEVIEKSRSGGIFTAISDYVLENNGVVYGCILTEDFKAKHIRVSNKNDRNLMRGSKYIQSELGDTFKKIQKDLQSGTFVLFSGTSCQISGLRNFLQKDYDNFICIDIVCHGVPSPLVWKKYLEWQEKRNKGKVIDVDFRNKKTFGWGDHKESLLLDDGKIIHSDVFKNLFCNHQILRPSCYKCPFKSIMHPGDITIADYWGIEKAAPEMNDNKGTSLVLINNDKGNKYFKLIQQSINSIETKIEDSLQPPLVAPFPKPNDRDKFWKDFNKKSFSYIAFCYGENGNVIKKIFRRVKRKLVK